jgi:hypothetical protein
MNTQHIEAINFLDAVAARQQMTRADHLRALQSVEILKQALTTVPLPTNEADPEKPSASV